MSDERKVVPFPGCSPVAPGEPVPEVVAILKNLLERAERGDIIAICGSLTTADRLIGQFITYDQPELFAMIGALACQQRRLERMVDGEDEEADYDDLG